jgi:hypothetical protein
MKRRSGQMQWLTPTRIAAYELAAVPGKEKEAYARLKALYEKGRNEHLPTLLNCLGSWRKIECSCQRQNL